MSAWLVEQNTFINCEVGTFTGGGRRNTIRNNSYENCGTVHYLNNQGMTFDNSTVDCDEVEAPGDTECSTGAALWMATESPAAAEWARRWPEMLNISGDLPGYPAFAPGVVECHCFAFTRGPKPAGLTDGPMS